MKLAMRMYKRDNGIWYVALPGNKRNSLKTKDKDTALRHFNKIKKELLRGNLQLLESSKSKISLSDYKDEYLKHRISHNKKASTVKRDQYSLLKMIDYIGKDVLLSDISVRMIDNFFSHLLTEQKPSSVDITFRHIKSAFNQAVKWEYINKNPLNSATKIKVQPLPPKFYSAEEISKILEEIKTDQDFHDLIICYLYTGLRRSELFYLESNNVNLQKSMLTVTISKTKWRSIPFGNSVSEIFQRRCKMNPTGRLWQNWNHPDRITHRWVRLMKKLKLKGRLHDLRHSYASYLVEAGQDIRTIAELLGHKDISTTMIYAHLTPNHLQSAITELEKRLNFSTKRDLRIVND